MPWQKLEQVCSLQRVNPQPHSEYGLDSMRDFRVLATSDIRSEKTGDVPRTSRRHDPLVLAPGAPLKKEGLISSEIYCFAASSGSKAKS